MARMFGLTIPPAVLARVDDVDRAVDRRAFVAGGLSVIAALRVAEGQPAGKVYRIGVLSPGPMTPTPGDVSFREALRERGWNLAFERRGAEGKPERLPDLAAELVRLNVDVIVAIGVAALPAKQATATIPIVIWNAGDPVGTGLVQSLARPGGNVTGLSFDTGLAEVGKRLELLREVLPKASRVAVLDWPLQPGEEPYVEARQAAARAVGLQLTHYAVRTPQDFDSAFAAMARAGEQAVHVVDRSSFRPDVRLITDLAARYRLPAVYNQRVYVAAGGLMSYGKDERDEPRRVATYVDKIFRGAKPADLPVEQPTKFELIISLRTAKALGLAIPPSVLARADEVLE